MTDELRDELRSNARALDQAICRQREDLASWERKVRTETVRALRSTIDAEGKQR